MTPTEIRILTKCLQVERATAANKPELWQRWDRDPWVHSLRYGPPYEPRFWFGSPPNSEIVKIRRTIRKLSSKGLLTEHCRWGERLTSIKLTKAGRIAARELLNQPQEKGVSA